MTMRTLINLIEAKAPATPSVTYGSPEYYRRYANPQAAQTLARFRQQAANDIPFNMTLVAKAVKATKAHMAAYEAGREEGDRVDPHAAFTSLMENLIEVNGNRHIADKSQRLDDFQNRKPDVEQSDELTYLQIEFHLMKEFEFWCDPADAHFAREFMTTLETFGNMLRSGVNRYGLNEGLQTALATHIPVVVVFLALCNGADPQRFLG